MRLKVGEMVCDKCNGSGIARTRLCKKCYGLGKLDWIDNIKGSNETFKNFVHDEIKKYVQKNVAELNKEISGVFVLMSKLEQNLNMFKETLKP